MISNKIITGILLFLGFVSSFLTISLRTTFGKALGNLMRILSKKRRNITLENIAKAFSEKSADWHIEVMKESYRNLGITLIELLTFRYFKEEDFVDYVRYENIELIEELRQQNRGLILLSGHFGNWEMLAYTAGLFTDNSILIIVKPQKNTSADKFLNKYRTQGGNNVVSMYNRAAREIVRMIRQKGIIALLADQSASKDKDIFVDFFGRPAVTYESPAALALKFNVPIIMGFSVRQSDGTYRVRLFEIQHEDLDNSVDGIKELTKRHVKALEDAVRQNPGLWAWQHRRWKHKPVETDEKNS